MWSKLKELFEPKYDAVLINATWTSYNGLTGIVFNDKKKRFENHTRIWTTEVQKVKGNIYYTKNTRYKVNFVGE